MDTSVVAEDLKNMAGANLPWDKLAGKTILISGANGFLPAYLVELFLYLNQIHPGLDLNLVGLVRNPQKAGARFAAYRQRRDLQLLVQDVSIPVAYSPKVDWIIHAASQASPKYYGSDPVGTLKANVLGTYNLLELARAKKAENFLFFSSGEVYGKVDAAWIPTAEGQYGYLDPTDLRSCYAESKRMGETMCVSWAHQYGIPVKIARPFHTYGPGMSLDDGRVFADFVADVVNHRDIVLKSDGRAKRAFCYLADAIVGFCTVLLKGANGEAYNVGNEKGEIAIGDLARKLVQLFPERKLKVIEQERSEKEYLPSATPRSCPATAKIAALGWQPVIAIEAGFARTIRSFEQTNRPSTLETLKQ
jgi:UDP-glucuronate decarboxylase